mmetsp:Transcript_36904/g.59988  ORF Transcript_36904/g.59988 Transcript_36904/m.59988 type:complete len:82 (+) Transcript_36904:2889-3134(+)
MRCDSSITDSQNIRENQEQFRSRIFIRMQLCASCKTKPKDHFLAKLNLQEETKNHESSERWSRVECCTGFCCERGFVTGPL